MVAKSNELIVAALERAAAEPQGLPLIGNRKRAGLFGGNASAKKAAQEATQAGWLRIVRTETVGKSTTEVCTLTEKGLAHLLAQVSTRQVLEDFIRALEARRCETSALVDAARAIQTSIEALKGSVEGVLKASGTAPDKSAAAGPPANGSASWKPVVLSYLAQWQAGGAMEDCPVPELYRKARQACPSLSVGQFHDGLRSLYQQERIHLHPWTGPLHEIPEPANALLVGHAIAYYVSLRDSSR